MKGIGFTKVGSRHSVNEDAYRSVKINDKTAICIVCDGVGGEKAGEVASNITCDEILKVFADNFKDTIDSVKMKNLLINAVKRANTVIRSKSAERAEYNRMGTTVVVAVVFDKTLFVVNAGDSRAYLIRNNEINQITKDHTMVQFLLDKGEITKSEAENYPEKNIITRAVGAGDDIELDFYIEDLENNDSIILCSDGYYKRLEEDEITTGVDQSTIEELINMSISRGTTDDITVILVKIQGDSNG